MGIRIFKAKRKNEKTLMAKHFFKMDKNFGLTKAHRADSQVINILLDTCWRGVPAAVHSRCLILLGFGIFAKD